MGMDESQLTARNPLSYEGRSLQPVQVLLTDGLATYPADILRPRTKAKVLNNLLQSRRLGIWTNRDNGWTRHRANTFNSGGEFLDFGVFTSNLGVQTLIWQCGTKVQSYNIATTTETDIITGLNATALPTFRPFQATAASATPRVIYTSSALERPYQITSVSAAAQFNLNGGTANFWGSTAAPMPVKNYEFPAFCEPFQNRMAYGSFNATTSTDTGFDVLITNYGTYDTVSQSGTLAATDGVIVSVPPILGPITGLRSYKLSNANNDEVLIIGCAQGVAVVVGSSALDYQLRILTREYGVLSNRCWVDLLGDLLFLATDGVRLFSTVNNNGNLIIDSLTFELQDVVNSIEITNASKAFAVHHKSTQDIQFWFPVDGEGTGHCSHALVMNYGKWAYSKDSAPAWSTRNGTEVACAIDFPDQATAGRNKLKMFAGGYTGVLQVHYSGSQYDSLPNEFEAVFPLVSGGDVSTGQSIRKIIFITSGGDQSFLANTYAYETRGDAFGSTVRVQASQVDTPCQTLPAGGTVLGTTFVLGSASFPTDHTKLIDYEPTCEGRFLEVQIRGNTGAHFVDLLGADFILSGGGTRR